jgi:peptidoglycan/LPS O-acetylase OafA/YrhL
MAASDKSQRRTLRAMGVTLLGVLLSVGFTVGFGVPGPWWSGVLAGAATVGGLVVVVKLATAEGSRGLVARLADWITGSDQDGPAPP